MKRDSSDAWRMLGDSYDALAGNKILEEKWNEVETLKNKAISCFRESIKLDPNYAETYALLGNTLWGFDFRESLKEYEKALSLEPDNKIYKGSVDQLKSLIKENTFALNNLKVFLLKSTNEEPCPDVLKEEFYWQHSKISSAVIYDCHGGTETQKTFAWLFESEKPDLIRERPVAQVSFIFPYKALLTESGERCKVHTESRCPSNYASIVQRLYKDGLI